MLNLVQQVFYLLSKEGSLVITRAYQPYTLVGPPVRGLVLDPLAVYSSRTVHKCSLSLQYFARNFCQILKCNLELKGAALVP